MGFKYGSTHSQDLLQSSKDKQLDHTGEMGRVSLGASIYMFLVLSLMRGLTEHTLLLATKM